jgi:uncharacterized protein YndB with AHSA1/START domain
MDIAGFDRGRVPTPTGKVTMDATGAKWLVLERQFDSDIEDVWASLTESERTAKWIGPWTGEPGVGNTISLRMGFEEDSPVVQSRIDACAAPVHLAFTIFDPRADWALDLVLSEEGGATKLVFTQSLPDPNEAENMGPGWEWYLDTLLASRLNHPLPDFDDYYPAQSEYYAAQNAAAG